MTVCQFPKSVRVAVFDVDGTLTPFRRGSTGAFERRLLHGVEARMRELADLGIPVALASNQGGVRKGLPIGAVHAHMRWLVETLRSFGCEALGYKFAVVPGPRKKPKPGMLMEWAREAGVPPAAILFVGDAESDARAAAAAGCQFAWASRFFGNGRERLQVAAAQIAAKFGKPVASPAKALRRLFVASRWRERGVRERGLRRWKRGELFEFAGALMRRDREAALEEWGDVGYYVAQTWGWLWRLYEAVTPDRVVQAAVKKFEKRAWPV